LKKNSEKAKDADSLINAMKGRFPSADFTLALSAAQRPILMR